MHMCIKVFNFASASTYFEIELWN